MMLGELYLFVTACLTEATTLLYLIVQSEEDGDAERPRRK